MKRLIESSTTARKESEGPTGRCKKVERLEQQKGIREISERKVYHKKRWESTGKLGQLLWGQEEMFQHDRAVHDTV